MEMSRGDENEEKKKSKGGVEITESMRKKKRSK